MFREISNRTGDFTAVWGNKNKNCLNDFHKQFTNELFSGLVSAKAAVEIIF
jgi:hypothetical protein